MMSTAHRLQETGEHVKNYHPQILVLAGNLFSRPSLIDLAHEITRNNSLLIVGEVKREKISYHERVNEENIAYRYFRNKSIKAFYNLIDNTDVEEGVKLMIQSSGFGRLKPNIVLMGYQSSWITGAPSSLKAYYSVLKYVTIFFSLHIMQ